MAALNLTPERLRELLDYDPETGVFTHRTRGRGARGIDVGDVAGCVRPDGYVDIGIDGQHYLAHRLAWFYIHNVWPRYIDHKDAVRANNRIDNLRDVTNTVNMQNLRTATKASRCGKLGASKNGSGYSAVIRVNGKKKYLGQFRTADEAHAAYIEAKRKLHDGCQI